MLLNALERCTAEADRSERRAVSVFESGVNVDLPKLKSAGSDSRVGHHFPARTAHVTGYSKAGALESISSKIEIVHSQGNLEVHKWLLLTRFSERVTSTLRNALVQLRPQETRT